MFARGEIIQDERGERRWQILRLELQRLGGDYPLVLWSVRDLRLQRDLSMLSLYHARIPQDRLQWDIPVLHQCFSRLVKAISVNCNAFPEAIDWFTCVKHQAPSPNPEPLFVFSPIQGLQISALKEDEADREQKLGRLCKHVANLLRDIHQSGSILRALPLVGLRRNLTNHSIQIAHFYTLQMVTESQGFNPYEAGFHPSPCYAAPECFAPSAVLTPATDVYALGRLLLEYLGVPVPAHCYSPDELDSVCASLQLPLWWHRFFKLALHEIPEGRFQGMAEVLAYVLSRGQPEQFVASNANRPPASPPHVPRTQRVDAPAAALLLWAHDLHTKGQRFDLHALLKGLQARYSLGPMLYFVQEQRDMQNPFFQLLRKLSFEIIPFRSPEAALQILQDSSARWRGVPRHLIVGRSDQAASQILVQIAQ